MTARPSVRIPVTDGMSRDESRGLVHAQHWFTDVSWPEAYRAIVSGGEHPGNLLPSSA